MSSLACLPGGEEEAGGRGRGVGGPHPALCPPPSRRCAPDSELAEVSRLSPASQHLDRQGERQSAVFPVSLTSGDWGSYL